MPDRSTPPPIVNIEALELPPVTTLTLDNGMTCHALSGGTQDVVKVELVCHAGRPFERHPLASRLTGSLLKEGTARRSAAEMAEWFDFHGATLQSSASTDTASLTLYSLHSQLDKVLPAFAEMLEAPAFPEHELEQTIRRNQKLLLEDLSKNETVAYRELTALVFGPNHPYGYNSTAELYGQVKRSMVVEHFERCYTTDNSTLFVSGKLNDDILAAINKALAGFTRRGLPGAPMLPPYADPPIALHLDRAEGNQTAIRMGRRLFNRHHPDFFGMYVLNTVLGDYFGSRLVKSVREDKGYTYGIYSTLDVMHFDGDLSIATEVGHRALRDTLAIIHQEMARLREEPVSEDELAMVRSYISGGFLNLLDGPFRTMDVVKTLMLENLPLSFFAEMVSQTRLINPDQLQALAKTYLQPQDMHQVTVGQPLRRGRARKPRKEAAL